ncbi:zinc finger protein 284-like isoform X2 [Hyposmocoma kahamanoa]|uniref:zinc finger protein 284-like isoform X2 n=1 Tax=Hyposmocoma kahamanoa TaxID=1477025 RepID=UPI000E6D8025|nr:zinc finger protein 284-like isoform X2 [Hyposmocoma kahamanoa]
MSRRHPSAESKIKCELCEKRVNRNRLRRHVAIAHGTSALRCGYCKSEYDSKEVLIEHVVTCTAKKKTRKICESHCGRNFGNNYRLNEHCRAKHGYEKLKCSYCDFESAGVMALRNHERRHRNEKPFVCETCGAKFHAAYLLAQHKKSHRTEKLIKCNLCPATFKANNSLHTHKLSCHSNYLYKCHLCSRVYSSRHYAVKHLRHVHDYKGPVPQLQKVPNEVIIP